MVEPKKTLMPERPPEERIHDFQEVATGYTKEDALKEAKRCLQCKKPGCVSGCPVEVDIPGFISKVAVGDFEGANVVLKKKNSLPAICGRVCPQENQCEKVCVLAKKQDPVGIGRLERFVADCAMAARAGFEPSAVKPGAKKVAVVGAGPGGLTAASDMALLGYSVTLFEALHGPGGVLRYGIPEFRLPKSIVDHEASYVRSLGVDLKLNVIVGNTRKLLDLFNEGYKAIYVGTGAGSPMFLHIPGENLIGVYSANEFLTRCNLMKAYLFPKYDTPVWIGKKVAVVGGGNVAMDSARTALRLGAESVTIVYRRSEEELPARAEEVERAKEEGIIFHLLTAPLGFQGENGWIKRIECQKMELGAPDDSGRRRPVPMKGSEYLMDIDTVVVAIGNDPNPLIPRTTPELKTSKRGNILVEAATGATNLKGVYAGGDVVTGAATVIEAMGAARTAAKAMDEFLAGA